MRIAHVLDSLSTDEGRFTLKLYQSAEEAGHKVLLCYSEGHAENRLISYRIGTKPKAGRRKRMRRFWDNLSIRIGKEKHLLMARITDRSGFYSRKATRRLIEQLQAFQPELVHLHKLHGFYLHLPLLFEYLQKKQIPVLWSMRDCWAWTGHCIWYTDAEFAPLPDDEAYRRRGQPKLGCRRWLSGCGQCVLKKSYPGSLLMEQSRRNWQEKRILFSHLRHLIITVPCEWMKQEIAQSFLSDVPVYVLPDPIDQQIYQPPKDWQHTEEILRYYHISLVHQKPLILCAAKVWDHHAGLDDVVELADRLGDQVQIGIIGLDDFQRTSPLPENLLTIPDPHSERDFAAILTAANLYVDPSHGEASPISLAKALSCGTRVLCYDVAAYSGFIPEGMGESVPLMDIEALAEAAQRLIHLPKTISTCRESTPIVHEKEILSTFIQLYEGMYDFAREESGE